MERAYIELVIDKYNYKIRIPRYYNSSSSFSKISTSLLPIAKVCALPGCHPLYSPGDIVFVEFENDRKDMPVIMGLFYSNNISKSQLAIDSISNKSNDYNNDIYERRFQVIESKINKLEGNV